MALEIYSDTIKEINSICTTLLNKTRTGAPPLRIIRATEHFDTKKNAVQYIVPTNI